MMTYLLVKSDVEAFHMHADNLLFLANSPGLPEWMGWDEKTRKMMAKDARTTAGNQ